MRTMRAKRTNRTKKRKKAIQPSEGKTKKNIWRGKQKNKNAKLNYT